LHEVEGLAPATAISQAIADIDPKTGEGLVGVQRPAGAAPDGTIRVNPETGRKIKKVGGRWQEVR
jgi:hypothetical protein